MNCDELIVGAGPAGLARAFWRLDRDPDADVLVVESSSRAGGWVQTWHQEGYSCELGPQGFRPNEDTDALIDALGVQHRIVPASAAAKKRFIGRGGRLHPLPAGPAGLMRTELFGALGKLRLFTEPLRRQGRDPEETISGFVSRRFGPQAARVARTAVQGIFGGDADRLEMRATFPAVALLESEHGSVLKGALKMAKKRKGQPKRPALCSTDSGMEGLVSALGDALGSRIQLDSRAAAIERDDQSWRVTLGGPDPRTVHAREIVLALPARMAAPLLADAAPELAAELGRIPYASVASTWLGIDREAAEVAGLEGFGFLLDPDEGTSVLGVLYCSSIFPGQAPEDRFLVRVMTGGMAHPEVADASEESIASEAEQVFRSYTGFAEPIRFRKVGLARQGIPQYVVGHGARLGRIRELLAALPGLRLIGNSYRDVSLPGQLCRTDALAE